MRSGLAEFDKTGAARVEARRARGEMTRGNRGETGDALASRGKGVAQFAGHGDRVAIGAAQLSMEGVEGGVEAVEAEPKRRRSRKRRFDPPVLHARRFQMRSADVPTDDDAHRSSRFDQATLGRSKADGQARRARVRRLRVGAPSRMSAAAMEFVAAKFVRGASSSGGGAARIWPRGRLA